MKYIDAEQLKCLLDAKYKEFVGKAKIEGYTTLQYQYMADGIDIAEQLIDSLQQEQPDEPVSDCHDLEEAAEEYASRYDAWNDDQDIAEYAFKAGAEWMKKQIPMPEDTVIFQKGVEEGKKLMMEGAVEGEVCILPGNVAYVKEKNNESLKQYLLDNFKAGDEARIIILPNDEDNDRTIV